MAQTGTGTSKVGETHGTGSQHENGSHEVHSRFFAFFLISGFCSVLYELIWLRLSMAEFGVTTAMTSIVISVFMAGLGLGSWGAGKMIPRIRTGNTAARGRVYALIQFTIGIGSL